MELDLKKKLLINDILSKMIEWEDNNIGRTKMYSQGNPSNLRDYMMNIQREIYKQYNTNAHDYSMLIKLLENDKHILVDNERYIKVGLGAKKFLSDGGYNQSKYMIWVKDPKNMWTVIAFAIGIVVPIYLAVRK